MSTNRSHVEEAFERHMQWLAKRQEELKEHCARVESLDLAEREANREPNRSNHARLTQSIHSIRLKIRELEAQIIGCCESDPASIRSGLVQFKEMVCAEKFTEQNQCPMDIAPLVIDQIYEVMMSVPKLKVPSKPDICKFKHSKNGDFRMHAHKSKYQKQDVLRTIDSLLEALDDATKSHPPAARSEPGPNGKMIAVKTRDDLLLALGTSVPERLLKRMRELGDSDSKATAVTVVKPIFSLNSNQLEFSPSPFRDAPLNSVSIPMGYELAPQFAETRAEFRNAIECYDASGKPVCNSVGENIVVHPGQQSEHVLQHTWSDSRKKAFDSLMEWSHENWLSISKLVPLELNGGVAFKAGAAIWLDFLIQISKREKLVKIAEPQTMVAENQSATQSAIELARASSFAKIGALANLPDDFVPETWFIENLYVWDNSIFALEWLANALQDELARIDDQFATGADLRRLDRSIENRKFFAGLDRHAQLLDDCVKAWELSGLSPELMPLDLEGFAIHVQHKGPFDRSILASLIKWLPNEAFNEEPVTVEDIFKAYSQASGTAAEKEAAVKHLIDKSQWSSFASVKSAASRQGIKLSSFKKKVS